MFNQRLLFVVTFFTLALSVLSSPLQERATSRCNARDIAVVRRTVSDENYFCKWWLSDIRTRSPFLEFTHSQVTDLCKCISSSNTASKPKREEGSVEAVLEKRQSQASCEAEMSKQFTEPWHFCTFYNAYPRTTSPFALYSAKQLLTLCKCVVTKQTSSVHFCSSQSTILASKPTLLSQASQYCSSLLRPTVFAVTTITGTTTVTKTRTQGTSIASLTSTIRRTSAVNEISTEKVIQSVTAKSTATETSIVVQYIDTTNLGTVSLAINTETSVQTVNVAASTEVEPQTIGITSFVRRYTPAPLVTPSFWKTLAPPQATQACKCIMKPESLKPITIYTSYKSILSTTTSFTTKQAQRTRVISVTRVSTVNKLSTLRTTLTSIVSTAVQTQTLRTISKAILTTSVDSVSTSIDQVFSMVTYTCPSVASVTPTTTVWTTSLSTVTDTTTISVPTVFFTTIPPSTQTVESTSFVTAEACTYPDPSTVQVFDKRTLTSERTVYSTVSVCPTVSTDTSTITSVATSLTTRTTIETALYADTTITVPGEDPEITTQTITSMVTPTCTTATVYVSITTV